MKRLLLAIFILTSCSTPLPKRKPSSKELKPQTWFEALNSPKKLFIKDDSHEFLEEFNGLQVRLIQSSFEAHSSLAPKFIDLKYDLLECPDIDGFHEVIKINHRENQYDAAQVQFTNLRLGGCGLNIRLKRPFLDHPSIFSAYTEENE
ncbi:MAG: hypothetical protein BM556_10975 [Bacteriovorax sp. MedPE-SWde]|nr:MAG: hypothetical protein BM556_10975 [Bacteriovorax sp. MedPE-SWde]